MTRAQWCLTPQGIHSFIHSWLHQKNNSVLFPISAFLPGSSLGTWQEGMSWTWQEGMLGRLIFITPFGDLPKNSKPSTILFG